MPISTIDDVWYRNAFVYGTWPEKSLAKSSYKNCLNSQPENDPSDMFLVVCVHLLLWFFLHFCGMLKVLVQLYFQVHYYDVSTVVWKSHKKSHFTLFASVASFFSKRFEFQLQVLAWKFIFKWDIFWSFSNHCTVFENHPKCRIWIWAFGHFTPIFDLLILTCLVTLFDRKL